MAVQKKLNLFAGESTEEHPFPPPQYLGAKYIHLPWIRSLMPATVHTAVDAFGGSQSVAFMLKQLGCRTWTNDFLDFNHQIGLALVENGSHVLTNEDIALLFSPNPLPSEFDLMQSLFTDLFFEEAETRFLDAFRGNVERLDNPYKRALALTVMNRSMTRKTTMGHFAHTQALNYAASPERVKRNRSLVRPLKEIFLELLPVYQQAVFDNGCENKSFRGDAIDFVASVSAADMAYFDPPYCDSHADYQGFYHLLETYTEYWKDKEFINGTKRYSPKRPSGFEKKSEIVDAFRRLFTAAVRIPVWMISYNDRSYPDIDTLVHLIKEWRTVTVYKKGYVASRGGKGSVAGSHEVLILCKELTS